MPDAVDAHDGQPARDASVIPGLVRDALGKRRDLTGLLDLIVGAMEADGCVLWEVAPGSAPSAEPPEGYLFALASSFLGQGGSFARHDLPIHGSAPGRAMVERRLVLILGQQETFDRLFDYVVCGGD